MGAQGTYKMASKALEYDCSLFVINDLRLMCNFNKNIIDTPWSTRQDMVKWPIAGHPWDDEFTIVLGEWIWIRHQNFSINSVMLSGLNTTRSAQKQPMSRGQEDTFCFIISDTQMKWVPDTSRRFWHIWQSWDMWLPQHKIRRSSSFQLSALFETLRVPGFYRKQAAYGWQIYCLRRVLINDANIRFTSTVRLMSSSWLGSFK